MNIRFDFDVLNLLVRIIFFTFEESPDSGKTLKGICGLKVSLYFQKFARIEVGQIWGRKLRCVKLESILQNQIFLQATINLS